MNIFTLDKTDNIAILTMNDLSQSQNVLNKSIQEEFSQALTDIEADKELKAVILTSSKDDCFIAGADINMLLQIESADQAKELSLLLHQLTQRIVDLPITTVAAINGACLGGGLELALAFDYRVASSHGSTKIGVPEVQLGLLPGGGGTQRLPRLINLPSALDLMLTGRQLNGLRAQRAGLVDQVVAPEILLQVATKFAAESKPKRRKSFKDNLLSLLPVRTIILSQARKKVLQTTKGHFPAPLKILDTVQQGLATDLKTGLTIEAENFAELVMTPESKQLINIFFAINELKKDSGIETDQTPRPITKVGVLGAGLMGAGISYVTIDKAQKTTRLKDISVDNLARGIAYVGKILDKRVTQRRLKSNQRHRIMARLTGSIDYSGFANADIVVEAVFESLDLKQKMLSDIESLPGSKEIIFATNTSAIPIDSIAAAAKHPDRVVGMHYFSPVEKMPLVEVVRGTNTADWVTATVVALGKQQGKTVIVVNDGPGFYTTRILAPYIMEAVRLVLEGVAIEDVDKALEQFGFPVGPIKLMDEVGIDVGAHIVETLHAAFGTRVPLISGIDAVLHDDRQGRKNRRGFYKYDGKSKATEVDASIYDLLGISNPGASKMADQEIAERVVLTMLNEAAFCLGEGILRNQRDGDIGAVFGLGFPPFLGGPFSYMKTLGTDTVLSKLDLLRELHGDRFTPAPVLTENKLKTKTTEQADY